MAPGPVVSHHRDLGALVAPLLIVSMLSGVMMLFQPVRTAVLGGERRPAITIEVAANQDVQAAIATAAALFPGSDLRRITMPRKPGQPIALRLRQPFEWTPNGRTFVKISGDGFGGDRGPGSGRPLRHPSREAVSRSFGEGRRLRLEVRYDGIWPCAYAPRCPCHLELLVPPSAEAAKVRHRALVTSVMSAFHPLRTLAA